MTALNALVREHAAHLFTDGGLYDAQAGRLVGIGNKVQIFPHLNAAIASNGWAAVGYMIWDAITQPGFTTFDQVAHGFGSAIQQYARTQGFFPPGRFEAALIGWSEAMDAPQAWVLCNQATAVAPYLAREVRKSLTPYDLDLRKLEPDESDPATYGLAVMELQRSKQWDTATGGKGVHAVGGFAQHTRVDRTGIKVEVLRHWD
ncbi:hypothetical protein [Devosia sp. 1635]|uniref:hypothetical protein n=1 Tax=Devosia sp. 1635 TaxID=2726066 RepID=UPI001564D0AA|nr:hypothetical protein [Devosia sp. 1635]